MPAPFRPTAASPNGTMARPPPVGWRISAAMRYGGSQIRKEPVMAQHQLRASPQTVRIGLFDATFPSVLTIESGDRVVVQCVSGRDEVMPAANSGLAVPPELDAILKANPGARAGHIVTGPIAVAGAEPGDM